MNNVLAVIDKFLAEGEKIIYEFPEPVVISIRSMPQNILENRKIHISNYGNLYFSNEAKNSFFYHHKKTITEGLTYEIQDNFAICSLKNYIVSSRRRNTIFSTSFIDCTLRIPANDLVLIRESLTTELFIQKDIDITSTKDTSEETLSTTILSGEHLTKVYGDSKEDFTALKDVSIQINSGDFICIMGPSGSGKSTLINNLSTIDAPTKGVVKFRGKNLLSMGEKEMSKFRYENLGFIFQDFNLINNLTIKENIALPLILAAIPRNEIEKRLNEIAATLDISEVLNKYPSQCSGGQKQRAACARALVTNPQIIVADEPTGNLDTKNSHELLKMLQRLNEEKGITILMVTHDNMIASYSKKLIFIRDGKVAEVLEKGTSTQKEFFYKIVDITSEESQNLIDIL